MTTLKTQQVAVKRDLQTIAAEVFEHEIPILQQIHLYENVKVLDPDYGELEIPDDAELEYRRLQGKYDRKNVLAVARVYRSPYELSKATGLTLQEQSSERPSEAGIRVNRKRPTQKKVA